MRRILPGLITVAVAVSGLAGCGVQASTVSSAPAAAPVSAAPITVLSTAVPKPLTAAPALATTGSAWPKVLASLSAYGQWLLTNPDPALVGNVATPGCPVASLLSHQVQALVTENAHVVTSAPAITVVTSPSPAPSGQAVLMVTASRPAEPVVSRGKPPVTIGSYSAVPQASFEVTLDQGADGKWRYCSIENQPDESQDAVPLL